MPLSISPFSFNYHGLPQSAPQPQKPVWGPPDMSEQLQKGIAGILPALAQAYKGTFDHRQAQIIGDNLENAGPAQQAAGLAAPGQAYGPPAPAQPSGPTKLPSFAKIEGGIPSAGIGDLIGATAATYKLAPDYLTRLVQVESQGDPNARNKSGAAGLTQFMPGTWASFGGGGNVFDPAANLDAAGRLTVANADVLRQGLGREPTQGELYLAHQQGAGGALALLKNPDARAFDVAKPKNILANLPGSMRSNARDLTAGQFASLWTSKFPGEPGQGGPPAGPQVAQAPPQAPAAAPAPPQPVQTAGLGPQAGIGMGPPQVQGAPPPQPGQPNPASPNQQPLFSTGIQQPPAGAPAMTLPPTAQAPAGPAAPQQAPPAPLPAQAQAPAAPPPSQPAPPPAPRAQPAPPGAGGAGAPQLAPAQPQQVAQQLAQVNPHFRRALAAAARTGNPAMLQAVTNAGEKLLGGDDYTFLTAADGSIVRAHKRTGALSVALPGSKARDTKEVGGVLMEAPPPGSPPGTQWTPVGGAVQQAELVPASAKERRQALGIPPNDSRTYKVTGGGKEIAPIEEPKAPTTTEADGVKLVYNPQTQGWEKLVVPGADGKFKFHGNSVEGQALNQMVKQGTLTEAQALDLATGKTITNPDGSMYFFRGSQLLGIPPGQTNAVPITPPAAGPPAGGPPASPPAAPPPGPPAEPIAAPPAAPPPAAAPPTGPTQLTPPKVQLPSPEVASRIGLGNKFIDTRLPDIRKDVDAGLVDITNGNRAKMLAGYGRPGEIARQVESGKEALLRGLTGAGMSESEAKAYVARYSVSYRDDRDTVKSKLDGLEGDLVATRDAMLAGRNITDKELTGKKKTEIKTPGGNTLRKEN